MTRNDNAWVSDMFAISASDWTPESASEACVLYAPVSPDPDVSRRCASVLSDTEQQRADRFVTEDLKSHFKQRRAFRRYCAALALGSSRPLSQIVFHETERGRPYLLDLPNLWFSFSSCRLGFLGAWSSTHRIGIDLEDQTRSVEPLELARRFFSEAEAMVVKELADLERLQTFFQLWSLKEAALKSIGEGLPFGLDAFQFELLPSIRMVRAPREHGGPERFGAHLIEEASTGQDCAALVTRSVV